MKRISYIFLLSVFVTSCANLTSQRATVTPQATLTLTPTFTPTITPTITLTPTETPDPNMPSDATGKDPVTGEYTKSVEENGETTVYIWKQFQFGDNSTNGINGHWFKSWMANGPINLTGYGENCEGMDNWEVPLTKFTLNMNVYAIESQADLDKIGYIFHPDRELIWKNSGLSCGNSSLPFLIMRDLFLRYINLLPGDNPGESFYQKYLRERELYAPNGIDTTEGQQRYYNDHKSFAKALTDGSMTIKIGDDEWIPNKGYEVYWIDESMVKDDPMFYYATKAYYLKTIAKDGKLIAFIAPAGVLKGQLALPKKDSRERVFKSFLLFPLEATITSTYPIENVFPQDYQGTTGIISGAINGKSLYIDIPFIDFTSTQ